MMTDDTVRESRLRRAAARRGLTLQRSRGLDGELLDHGGYMLIDSATDMAVAGSQPGPYSLDLDGIQAWLSHRRRPPPDAPYDLVGLAETYVARYEPVAANLRSRGATADGQDEPSCQLRQIETFLDHQRSFLELAEKERAAAPFASQTA